MRAWWVVAVLGLLLTLIGVPESGPADAAVPGLNFTQTGCDGYSDSVARLYTAGFDRVPEQGGFQYWMAEYTSGRWSLPRMATFFTQSAEFVTRYGALSQDGFIRQIYRNVLGREGEEGGVAFWNSQLSGGMDRGTLLLRFSESPENIARSGTSQPTLGPYNAGVVGPWTCVSTPPPAGPTPGSLVFATPLSPVSVTAGGDATFSWAASAPSGGTVRYKIETNAEDGVGDGNGWWEFGIQTSTQYTFKGVQLSDTGTIVRVTASNGVDSSASSQAVLTVTSGSLDCTPTLAKTPWEIGTIVGPQHLPSVGFPHVWVRGNLYLSSKCGAGRLGFTGAKEYLILNGGQLSTHPDPGQHFDIAVSLPCRMESNAPAEVTGVTGYSLDANTPPASIANIQPTFSECARLLAGLGACSITIAPAEVSGTHLVVSWRAQGDCYDFEPGDSWPDWSISGTVDYQGHIVPLTPPEGGPPRVIVQSSNSGLYYWDLAPYLNCPSSSSTTFGWINLNIATGTTAASEVFTYNASNVPMSCRHLG